MIRMGRYSFYRLLILAVLLLVGCAGSTGEVKVRLGEEFSLPMGQTAVITGEEFRIEFVQVSEDSRCPKDVTCIWEGRVTAVVEISTDGSPQQLNLTEPGLTDAPARVTYGEYELTYQVLPYPGEATTEIAADEYRLLLVVSE
jgi:hypothetical protein